LNEVKQAFKEEIKTSDSSILSIKSQVEDNKKLMIEEFKKQNDRTEKQNDRTEKQNDRTEKQISELSKMMVEMQATLKQLPEARA
jgi:Mg2+ and Co2+ transporter CorA